MTEPVIVTGGTGELGRGVVRHLLAAARSVRVISRRPRPSDNTEPCDWATADLMTGRGLDTALVGATAIVHCAGRYRPRDDVHAIRTLITAARAASIDHLAAISIVGIDRIPFPYYQGKVQIEKMIIFSGIPYTIQRTTQFHELLRMIFAVAARSPIMPVFDLPFQPVASDAAAARLAALAIGSPIGRATDLGGPEVRSAVDLAGDYLAFTDRRRPMVPVRLPGAAFRAFRRGEHLTRENAAAGPTFADHLAAITDPRSIHYGSTQ